MIFGHRILRLDRTLYSVPGTTNSSQKTMSAADALVTVSRTWADRLRSRYPQKSVYYIANGCQPR